MRHDHTDQRAAERQRIQEQLDKLAKLRGYTLFTLESPPTQSRVISALETQLEPHPTTLPKGLRRLRTGLEFKRSRPLPHPAAPKPSERQESFYKHSSHHPGHLRVAGGR